MWLGGHHQVPIFTVLGIGGLWTFHIVTGKTRRTQIDRAALFAVVIGAMVMAGALQLFPSYSYGLDSVRWVGAKDALHWNQPVLYSVHEQYSQPPTAMLGVFLDGFFRHANPFLGFTAFLLAILAVALAWNRTQVRLLAFLALGGMLFSFSDETLLHPILYSIVPMVEGAQPRHCYLSLSTGRRSVRRDYGIEDFLEYGASLTDRFTRVVGEPAAHRLYGVRYYLAKAQRSPDEHEVMSGAAGIKVFELAGSMSRVWTVHNAIKFAGEDIASELKSVDPSRSVFVPQPPALETCEPDRVALTARKAQFIAIDAEMNCRGMLILADSFSKDWTATVDGNPARIYPAYLLIDGVVLDRGRHRVEFRYRPWPVYWGALLTFSSFGIAIVLWRLSAPAASFGRGSIRQRTAIKESGGY